MMGFFEAELVSLWRARVRHLRPYYCSWKPKQTAKAVTSCDVWYLPVVMMSWFTALSLFILFSLYLDGTLNLFTICNNFNMVLNLQGSAIVLLFALAVTESEGQASSRHYISKNCYNNCSMCAHPHLRNGSVVTHLSSRGVPVTMVVPPLKFKCFGKRSVQYIIHNDAEHSTVISGLILLAGDVETNPGPVMQSLKRMCEGCIPENMQGWICVEGFIWILVFGIVMFLTFKVFTYFNEKENKRREYENTEKSMNILVERNVFKNPDARGFACIICNDYYNDDKSLMGAEEDSHKMDKALQHVNFATVVRNKTAKIEIEALLKVFFSYSYPPNYDCFVIVFSGHGKSSAILSNNRDPVDIEDIIIKLINSTSFEHSVLLFVDACRKGSSQTTSKPQSLFIAYATNNDSYSYGNPNEGGNWIQQLAKVIGKLKKPTHIRDIIISVNDTIITLSAMDKKPQAPEFRDTATDVIFIPITAGIGTPEEITPMCLEPSIHFPHQSKDIASLSSEVLGDLRQRLEHKLRQILIQFHDYKLYIQKYLEVKPVDIVDFCDSIRGIPVYDCSGTKFTLVSSQLLTNVQDYSKVFDTLGKFTSFLNYDLFEYVIEKYKIERKEALEYPDHLDKYINGIKITEFNIIKPIETNITDETKQLIIIMPCNSTCHLANVRNLRKHVANVMNLDRSGVLIYDIGVGSVVVTFLIPTSVAEFIFTEDHYFTPQLVKCFESLHIQQLKCNGRIYHFRSHVSGEEDCCISPDMESCTVQKITDETNLFTEHKIKIFEHLFKEFKISFMPKLNSFSELFFASKNLFNLDKSMFANGDTDELLQFISRQRKYANDYFEELKIIKLVGSDGDRERCDNYEIIYNKYVLNVAYKHQTQEVKNDHFLAIYVLDRENYYDLTQFTHKLASHFTIPASQLQVTSHELQLVSMQIPDEYISKLTLAPLYAYRCSALKTQGVQFLMFKKHKFYLSKWSIFEDVNFTFGHTIFNNEHGKIVSVNLHGDAYMAIECLRSSDATSLHDEEFVKYLQCILNHYHNQLPDVKGLFYAKKSSQIQYPLLITEKYEPLKNVSAYAPIHLDDQISILLDVVKCIVHFKSINESESISIKVEPSVLFFHKKKRLVAKLFPLHGFNFTFDIQGKSDTLPLQDLQWMMDITKYLHYSGECADKELPESHLLKKPLEQQWLSIEDRHRPSSFEKLREDLQDFQDKVTEYEALNSEKFEEENAEIHLILIGHSGVGKTSVRKHLKNELLDADEPPTKMMESKCMVIKDKSDSKANNFFLNCWDTGGHPIFQDLLPCFARLMCLYGIVFRLIDINAFDEHPEIRPYDKSQKAETSPFTNREIMYRNLAYIHVYSSGMQDELNTSKSFPAAIIIGTFRDQVPSDRLIKELNNDIQKSAYACSNRWPICPVSPSDSNSIYIHEIDNTNSGLTEDQGIHYLRENLYRCAKCCEVKSGLNWKRFKSELQRMCSFDPCYINVGVIPLKTVLEVGKECKVRSPQAALKYFHDLGIFMWYYLSKRESLHGFVVIEPKLLLEVFSKIFCLNNEYIPPEEKHLLEKGIITSIFLKKLLLNKASDLDNQWFVDFLEEHHLSSKVYFVEYDFCYFIPSLLHIHPDYKEKIANIVTANISPLYIVPQCGYIATGLFTRLLTALSAVTYGNTVWSIPLTNNRTGIKVCRNQFIFEVKTVLVILSEFSKYIRIDCMSSSSEEIVEEIDLSNIVSTLEVQLQRIAPLGMDNFNLTFECENMTCSAETHFFINKDILLKSGNGVECSNGRKSFLNSSNTKWCRNKHLQDDAYELFEKSLADGTLDLSIASVIFVGSKDLLSTNAKHAIFQDTVSTTTTPSLSIDHEIYFRAEGDPMLKKTDHYDDVILYSLCTNHGVAETTLTDTSHQTKAPSQAISSVFHGDQPSHISSSQVLPSHTNTPSQTQQINESQDDSQLQESIPLHEYSSQSLHDAADCEDFVQFMTNYKDRGKMLFYNVFDFGTHHHMDELYKIFIRNVSLCALVMDQYVGFEQEALEKYKHFTPNGLIVNLHSDSEVVANYNNESIFNHFSDYLIKNPDQPQSYMFSISPKKSDQKVSAGILSHASTTTSQKFPFSWYLFGFKLRQLMIYHNRNTVAIKEAMIFAENLQMDRPTVEAALEHLMENNIILYFKDILNDMVFLSMHMFSKIITELYKKHKSAIVNRSDLVNATVLYVSNDFTVDSFISLFIKLMIMAPCNDDSARYLVPNLLAPLDENEWEKIRSNFFVTNIKPVYFKCPSTSNEFISMLTVFLLTHQNQEWEIHFDQYQKPRYLHKNCVQFELKKNSCIVTLSFFKGYIEVYAQSNGELVPNLNLNHISARIIQGLEKIKVILNSHQTLNFNMSFGCTCGRTDAIYNSESGVLTCEKDPAITSPSSSVSKWIRDISDRTILEPLTINNIMKHLNHMSDQWIRVANILKLPSFVISSVQVSQFGNDQASLRKVVEWWFKSTANPEWNVIQQLYDSEDGPPEAKRSRVVPDSEVEPTASKAKKTEQAIDTPLYTPDEQERMYRDSRPVPCSKDERAAMKKFSQEAELILQTVNENEYQAAVTLLEPPKKKFSKAVVFPKVGMVLGMFAKKKTALIQTKAGGGAGDFIEDAIKTFPSASYIIGIGVCFAFDKSKYKLGDVIVSEKINDLANFKFDAEGRVEDRGQAIDVDNDLYRIFCQDLIHDPDFKVTEHRSSKVHSGRIISQAILLHNKEMRDKLHGEVRTAIGGEMEGGQLLKFKQKGKIKGIIMIKGVSDYADGNKTKEWQFTSALAALHYTRSKLLFDQSLLYEQ